MNEQEVRELMASSQTSEEWNANGAKVKEAFGGEYPDFWYSEVVISGIMWRTAQRWKA